MAQSRCVVEGCDNRCSKDTFRCEEHSRLHYARYFRVSTLRAGTGGGRRVPKIDGEGYYGSDVTNPESEG